MTIIKDCIDEQHQASMENKTCDGGELGSDDGFPWSEAITCEAKWIIKQNYLGMDCIIVFSFREACGKQQDSGKI